MRRAKGVSDVHGVAINHKTAHKRDYSNRKISAQRLLLIVRPVSHDCLREHICTTASRARVPPNMDFFVCATYSAICKGTGWLCMHSAYIKFNNATTVHTCRAPTARKTNVTWWRASLIFIILHKTEYSAFASTPFLFFHFTLPMPQIDGELCAGRTLDGARAVVRHCVSWPCLHTHTQDRAWDSTQLI